VSKPPNKVGIITKLVSPPKRQRWPESSCKFAYDPGQSLQAGVDAGHPGVYALGHLPNPTDIEGLDLQITGKRGLSPSNFRVRPQQSALKKSHQGSAACHL